MRLSTALLSATLLACTSGTTNPQTASDPHGPSGEVYGTRISADSGAIQDSVAVTLTISNPTSGTVHLAYGAPFTFARFTRNDTLFTTVSPTLVPDTIVLAPNSDTALAPIMVYLSTQPLHPTPTGEVIGVPAGTYNVAACAWPSGSTSMTDCGPNVQFKVTP